ncbi:dihydroorotate dehydrogenase [Treponema sp. C6A8]|uniref:dihydroorotate dehydrogenase n=1 Tax=Treponema sp. C6A8 TaxID=1410609 RepID=UPI00056E0A89|nr:dihydroorotate dehydrogenase [Treponema sp. C6A8]
MIKDCQGVPLPVFADGKVVNVSVVEGANPSGSVKNLKISLPAGSELPLAGQFYMLHAKRSDVLLPRPISVYHSEKKADGSVEIQFLILVKGKGTVELTSLQPGDLVSLLGPCGNRFEVNAGGRICIVGGGIGVAPVAGLAESLPEASYDFFASFKSGSYALDYIKPAKLTITTDDGSVGEKGMLSVAFTAELLQSKKYDAVYACGPTPMLAYIQKVCAESGTKCWLSMEAHMACGVGVCLGCVIDTTEGKKRCCKEGPIFEGSKLIFEKKDSVGGVKIQPRREPLADNVQPDLSVDIAGVHFENPVIGSSGAFGFGTEYQSVFDVNRLGGISSKGLTLEPRQGNDGIRLWETPSGLMNSIGLQNPGIPHFIKEELPQMMALKPVAIANLSGSSLETYVEGAKLLDKTDVPMIELNISCPNVSAGGAAFGMTCSAAGDVVRAVRAATSKPLVVKLTPQAADLIGVAMECIKSGAQGISLCNSFQGIAVDIERGVPVFEKVKAGVGGPAVRPIAVRLVYELVEAINKLPEAERVPVIAIGGIATWQDAVEFIMAGAHALQVGTATFANPYAMVEIIDGLAAFMKRKGYKSLADFRGCIQNK